MKAVKPLKTRAFIAKLLVLCMVLTLLPVSAFAVDAGDWEKDTDNNMYYAVSQDTEFTGNIGNDPANDVYYIYAVVDDVTVTLTSTSVINSTLYVGTKDGEVSGQTAMNLSVNGVHLNGALSIWPNVTIENLTFSSSASATNLMSLGKLATKTVVIEKDGDAVATVAGNITIPSGVTLKVEGDIEILANATLTIDGTLEVDNGAEIVVGDDAALVLNAGASVQLNQTGKIVIGDGATYTPNGIDPEGGEVDFTVKADITGTGTVGIEYDDNSGTLTNNNTYSIAKDTELTVSFTAGSGYKFNNAYYTVNDDAATYPLVDGDTVGVTGNITIHAVFDEDTDEPTPPPPSYNPSTPSATVKTEAATNGSFTVSDQNAKAGDTVTVKPAPAAGYMVDAVTVTDKNGDSVAVKNNGDGTYSFVMPEASKQPVTVKVTFKPVPVFSDVKADDYFADAVDWAVSLGYVSGKGDGKFVPYAGCTRAEFITILYAVAGRPEPTLTTTDFEDVDYDAFYGKALLWATEKGVCSGVTATKFAPNAVISRAQAVMMLYKAADTPEVPAGATMKFTDVAENAYYYNAVLWASSVGAIAGVTDTTFAPNADCLRAQTVTILHSFKTAD